MSKIEVLTHNAHGNLKLDIGFDERFDDVSPLALVTAEELPKVASDCPVFITKNRNSGQFELSAMLGLSKKENLFIRNGKWMGAYVPMDVRRQPFQACAVGVSDLMSVEELGESSELKLGINTDSNRLSTKHGVALFNSDGSLSEYVQDMFALLSSLIGGAQSTSTFLRRLADLDLIEPSTLSIASSDGGNVAFEGLYSIAQDRFSRLPDECILEFYKKGYMQASYAMIHSLVHVEKLVKWRSQDAK